MSPVVGFYYNKKGGTSFKKIGGKGGIYRATKSPANISKASRSVRTLADLLADKVEVEVSCMLVCLIKLLINDIFVCPGAKR